MNLLPDLFLTFFKIGLFTFGGGYAMIPLIQREVCTNSSLRNALHGSRIIKPSGASCPA